MLYIAELIYNLTEIISNSGQLIGKPVTGSVVGGVGGKGMVCTSYATSSNMPSPSVALQFEWPSSFNNLKTWLNYVNRMFWVCYNEIL